MSIIEVSIFLSVGRLAIWLLQSNGLFRPLWEANEILTELGGCDLCIGFWIFLGLAFALQADTRIFGLWPGWVEKVMLAACASFIVHLIKLGWNQKFAVTVV